MSHRLPPLALAAILMAGSQPALSQALPQWAATGSCMSMGSTNRDYCLKANEARRYEVQRAWPKIDPETRRFCVSDTEEKFARLSERSREGRGSFMGGGEKPAPSWSILKGCLKAKGAAI